MVLKDIPYRDGKLSYVKWSLKYPQRIRQWTDCVFNLCETSVTCLTFVTCDSCDVCDMCDSCDMSDMYAM